MPRSLPKPTARRGERSRRASGKYNAPFVAGGRVFVGTHRIQAYGLRAACHEQGRPDAAPRERMARPPVADLMEKLAFGSMQPHVLGLEDAQIALLAWWVTQASQ
jgi:hypothetical protein